MNTPILLIAWRRPNTLRQVIKAIKQIAPTRLYIACDGPNPERPGEEDDVAATRDVIRQEVDWPCQIERFYSDHNQGCRLGVSRAITWFFDQVEEGIVLEDDCVPHPDFFALCQKLLETYRHDNRVWCISGNNFQNGQWRGKGSYYFSRYNHCWGWATWRRCWQHYEVDLKSWPALRDSGLLSTIFSDSVESRYWSHIWQRLLETGQPDTWDYQWTFTCIANGGLTVLPNRNLVRNVGFGEGATHTLRGTVDTNVTLGVNCNIHPEFIIRDDSADQYTFDNHFGGKWQRPPYSLLAFLKRALKYPRYLQAKLHTKPSACK